MQRTNSRRWPWGDGEHSYTEDGTYYFDRQEHYLDLIAEWVEEPQPTKDEPQPTDPDFATMAAQHGIAITVKVGEMSITYDGRK